MNSNRAFFSKAFKNISFKGFMTLGIMVISLLLGGCEKKESGPNPHSSFHRYGIEKAHIHYEYSGNRRGSEDLYFTNYGAREAIVARYEQLGERAIRSVDELNIFRYGHMYNILPLTGTGIHVVDPALDSLYSIEGPAVPSTDTFFSNKMKGMSFRPVGTDTLAGRTATIWELIQSPLRIWTWRGLLLKRFVNDPNNSYTMTAVSFDTTSAIDTNLFQPPKGVEIKDRRPKKY